MKLMIYSVSITLAMTIASTQVNAGGNNSTTAKTGHDIQKNNTQIRIDRAIAQKEAAEWRELKKTLAQKGEEFCPQFHCISGTSRTLLDAVKCTSLRWPLDMKTANDDKDLQWLLEMGAEVNEQDENGRTALHWATEQGCIGAVEILLNHGADVTIADKDGKTAFAISQEQANGKGAKMGLFWRQTDVLRTAQSITNLLEEHGKRFRTTKSARP